MIRNGTKRSRWFLRYWDMLDDLWLRLLLWNGSAQLPTLLSYWKFGQSASQPDTIFGNPGLMLKDWGLVQILPHWTHWAVEYIDTLSKSEDGAPFFLYFPLTGLHTPIPNCSFPWVHQQKAGGCVWQLCLSDRWLVDQVMEVLGRNSQTENT